MAYLSNPSLIMEKRVLDQSEPFLARKIADLSSGHNPHTETIKAFEMVKDRASEIGRLYSARQITHDNVDTPVLSTMINVSHIQLPECKGNEWDRWTPIESQSSGSTLYFKGKLSNGWKHDLDIIKVNPYLSEDQVSISKKTISEIRFGKVIISECKRDCEDEHAIYRTEKNAEQADLYRHRDGTIKNLSREFSCYDDYGNSFFCGETLHIVFQPGTPLTKSKPCYYSLCHQVRDGKTQPQAYMTYQGHLPCSEFIFRGRLYARRNVIDVHDIFTPLKTTIDTPYETFDVKSGQTVDFFDFLGTSVYDQQFHSKDGFIYTVKDNVVHILE